MLYKCLYDQSIMNIHKCLLSRQKIIEHLYSCYKRIIDMGVLHSILLSSARQLQAFITPWRHDSHDHNIGSKNGSKMSRVAVDGVDVSAWADRTYDWHPGAGAEIGQAERVGQLGQDGGSLAFTAAAQLKHEETTRWRRASHSTLFLPRPKP